MAYITVENFRYGLDKRRSEFTSQVGVLDKLENGHVNQGGEIEKRKALVEDADFSNVKDSDGYVATFGLQDISINGVPSRAVFGSAQNGPIGINHSPTLVNQVPVGYTYVQLVHPDLFYPFTRYDQLYHRMVGVLCSTSFAGWPWVAALFSDGNVFIYYPTDVLQLTDNIPIRPIYSQHVGLVTRNTANSMVIALQLADAFTYFLEEAGWTVVDNHDDTITITAPPGDIATFNISVESDAGVISGTKLADSVPGVKGKSAVAWISVTSGTGGSVNTILAPDPNDLQNSQVDLLFATPVAWAGSAAKMAKALVDAINTHGVSGYTAKVVNSTAVFILAPADTVGGEANGLNIVINADDTIILTTAAVPMVAYVDFKSRTKSQRVGKNRTLKLQTDPVQASITGGLPPYRYRWSRVSGDDFIRASTPTVASTKFFATVRQGLSYEAQFVCTITDSSDTPKSVDTEVVTVTIAGLF